MTCCVHGGRTALAVFLRVLRALRAFVLKNKLVDGCWYLKICVSDFD